MSKLIKELGFVNHYDQQMLSLLDKDKSYEVSLIFSSGRPLYKNITLNEIQNLRHQLRNDPSCLHINYIESIVRYFEVNMWKIRSAMLRKWGKNAYLGLVLSVAYIVEAFVVTSDARYFNTVIKINKKTAPVFKK